MSTSKELARSRIYEISEERVEKYLLNIQERYFEVVAENLDLRQQVSSLVKDQNRILSALEKTLSHLSSQKENQQRLESQIQTLRNDLFQYFILEKNSPASSETEQKMRELLKDLHLEKALIK